MNNPKLKLQMAKLLPEKIGLNSYCHYWKDITGGFNNEVLETEWLYVMHLVEQAFLSTADPEERSRWFIQMQNSEWCGVTATFNQRAEAMCKVKGIEIV